MPCLASLRRSLPSPTAIPFLAPSSTLSLVIFTTYKLQDIYDHPLISNCVRSHTLRRTMYPHTDQHSSNSLFTRLGLGHQRCCRLDPQPVGNALTRSLTIKTAWTPKRDRLRKLKQETNNQAKSIWFRLPLEIREMIYRETLGGNRVAMDARTVKGLTKGDEWHGSRFRPSRNKWTTMRDNWGVPLVTGNDWNKVEGLLNLVVSCRRM